MKSIKSCVIVLNRVVDIAAAVGLYKKSPLENTKVLIVAFTAHDEYNWPKRKSIQQWLTQSDVNDIVSQIDQNDVIISRSKIDYKETLKKFDACVCLGRELFIFKPITKLSVGISGTRDYFERYIKLLEEDCYGDSILIAQNSNAWLDEKHCGDYKMTCDYDFLMKKRRNFIDVNPLVDQLDECKKIGLEQIKRELNFPQDRKIALISYRRADNWHTIYESDDEFFKSSVAAIEKFKKEGYFIVCRRRMGVDDITSRRANSSEITRYDEIKPLIDLEVNGWSGYPNLLYKACYASDVLVMIDTSGICQREAAITELPTYMPYDLKNEFTKNQIRNCWEPGMRDMIDMGVLSNDLEKLTSKDFELKIKSYNRRWHSGNSSVFWEKILR